MVGVCLLVCGTAFGSLDDGLVAYFPFNGNADEITGNSNDGTVYGATLTTDALGVPDHAYHFNGGQDIEVPRSAAIEPANQLTVSAWIKPSSLEFPRSQQRPILSKRYSITTKDPTYGWNSYLLGMGYLNDEPGFIYFSLNPLSTDDYCWSSEPIVSGEWSHVVGTYDGATIRLYINGELSATQAHSGDIGYSSLPLWIGTVGHYPYIVYWDGSLDDVRIYNRALSPSEVRQLYTGIIPFATFRPMTTNVDFADENTTDHLFFSGSLVLDEESDGIDLTTDEMVIMAGSLKMAIPAGSVQACGNVYRWNGEIDGASVKVTFSPLQANAYLFSIQAHGVDLTDWTNPSEWSLQIGNDKGGETIWLKGHLHDGGE